MLEKLRSLFRGRPVLVKGGAGVVEGSARRVEIGDLLAGTGVELLLCRIEGRLFAIDTRCPHEGGRMVPGPLLEGVHVLCPLHNYRFDPRTGAPWRPVCGKARTYKIGRASCRERV